jgi:hypothetical protein
MNSKALRARLPSSDSSIQRKGSIVISILVVALVVCTGLFGYAQQEDSVAHGWVKHTLEVQERIQDVGQGKRIKRIEVLTDGTLAQIDRLLPVLQAVHRGALCAGRTQRRFFGQPVI